MSPAADKLLGSVIAGRYEVVRVIGKGGMGTIYEVRNTRLGRSFALKTLGSGADEDTLKRFRREAEIVAKLTHPNILDVVDVETLEDGSPCMIMEYLRGEDLAQRLRASGPLAWPDYARIADQVLAALSVAHRAGVVHRDLKPQNIFLAADDNGDESVKLLDFGISKLRDARTFTTTDAKVMGTPAYMPPEQAEGKQDEVAAHSDVWSMGAILYEMACAQVAFAAPNIPAILYRVCHGRPEPLLSLRPDAPPELIAVIEHALTPKIADRLPTVDQLRIDLRAALGKLEGVSWPEPLRSRTSGVALARSPVPTPVSGVPKIGRSIDSGPVAMAETMVRGEAATIATETASAGPVTSAAAATPTPSRAAAPAQSVAAPSLVDAAAAPRRSKVPVVLLAAGVAVVGVGVVMRTRHSTASASHAATTPTPTASPAPAAPPVSQPTVPPVAPAMVTATIESTPTAADVFRLPSEIKVGITPWSGELERADGVAVFVLKKPGFSDQRVEVDLRVGGTSRIELAKLGAGSRPARHPAATGSGATPPADTAKPGGNDVKDPSRKKGEPVDPFGGRKKGEPVDPFGAKK